MKGEYKVKAGTCLWFPEDHILSFSAKHLKIFKGYCDTFKAETNNLQMTGSSKRQMGSSALSKRALVSTGATFIGFLLL